MKSVEEMIWKLGSSNYGLISNGYPYPEFAQVMYCRGISAYWTFVCFRDFVFDKPCAPWFDTNWRDLHNTINPIARSFAGQRENVVIEQTGPSAKIDGLRVGDMIIQSAKETHELVDWGARMNHCIGSYGREAASGTSHLFALWNGENLVANLELTPAGDVRQFYGRFNATPPKEIVDPVRAAIAKKMKEK